MSPMMLLMRVLEQGGKFIQCVKHGLTTRGFPVGPPRKVLQALEPEDRTQLEQVFEAMKTSFIQVN